MAKKMSTEDIEGELRKMIGNKHQQSTSQMKETHEIEADLKRMLNMPSAVVVTKEDLLDIKSTKPSINKQEKQAAKKKKKKKTHLDPDHPHHQHRQHQEEPGGPVTQEGSQPVAKKKNKKAKKEKNANTGTGVTEDREKEKQNSNKKEEDQGNNSHKKLYNSDFHRARYLDDKLTPAILNELEKEKIFPLKKKSAKFVNAKYFCRLCEYHCDNIPTCRQHANDKRHRRKKEIMVQDKMLKNLPHPSERHIEALDCLVENIYIIHGLTDKELKYRRTQADLIQDYLREKIPDLSLCLFGSSVTGLGLKTADVNMDLVLPQGANPALCLSEVYRILEQSEKFTNVKSDFQAKVPSVLFTSPCGTLSCQITVGNQLACREKSKSSLYFPHFDV
ncbi:terminal uridylyltransferase 4-like [Ruditapes philippinarum]|uniref:terminal uridylyltransferase 4-like n=1 Tax=Ruditapes philippinarum TaxID=129788 RepID=UPI00295AD79B|nr:terminal uridylyltransferase 4-like [Ruditapes philippinarum]